MTDFTVPLIALTFLAAGIVKGVTGMGLPTLAMGVLGALLSPLTAASLLIVPSMVTNLWQLLAGPRIGALARRLWPMMAASMAGTLIAAPLLAGGNGGAATPILGATLIAYALYTLLAPPFRVSPVQERWLSPLVGLVTGLIAGGTGVFVIPAVPWLQALGLEKDELVQALGMSFTTSTIALALGLASRQVWQVDQLALSVLAVVPALIGMGAGQILRRAVSAATFRRWFLIMLALLGGEMLLRGMA
ncbi:sulfite exporter TauE/SafE family protein [Paracoccus sp. pheM1]|uniref:sulfite exporter TauE/SafE family protein n=1 Tax=Paracoccus sp. pheM1 TaxID=2831675 RepID=UPI001BDB89E2|nr:sulfite exporter TauE/SafE family protein [Paracoccus sp. pheM1]MBT0783082.1 sulfite exporter TauE/SafE family protein [Paracoccus sp. pheM1]